MKTPLIVLLWGLAALSGLTGGLASAQALKPALSTEDFLNRLGVNTHLNGLSASDAWNTNPQQVGAQLRYLGVRLDRDWAHAPGDGKTWLAVQKAWSPYGRFWTSIDEASPADQRRALSIEEAIFLEYPKALLHK